MKCFRALLDFQYIGQYESHDTETLKYLDTTLATFHSNKEALSRAGVRDGVRRKGLFNVQKIELMHHVSRLIRLLGSAPQFSTDQTERCHITMAKVPYRSTNRKGFATQMCRFLDRQEKVHLFALFLASNELVLKHTGEAVTTGGSSGNVKEKYAASFAEKFLPKPVRNRFDDDNNPQNETTAFLLTSKISNKAIPIFDASELFKLPSLHSTIVNFFKDGKRVADGSKAYTGAGLGTPPFQALDIWHKVRMQLRAEHDMKNRITARNRVGSSPLEK